MITAVAKDEKTGTAITKKESGEFAIVDIATNTMIPIEGVTEAEVDKFVEATTFEKCNIVYYNIDDLIKELTDAHVNYIKSAPIEDFKTPEVSFQLMTGNEKMLVGVLRHIKKFMLPNGRLDIAKIIAKSALANPYSYNYRIRDEFREIMYMKE